VKEGVCLAVIIQVSIFFFFQWTQIYLPVGGPYTLWQCALCICKSHIIHCETIRTKQVMTTTFSGSLCSSSIGKQLHLMPCIEV